MINATVCGNLGADAVIRQAGSSNVCSFSVASTTKVKGEDATTWVRCSMFGARGDKLAPYLTKGKMVAVSGSLTTREHDNKTHVELNVSDLKLMGGDKAGGGQSTGGASRPAKPPSSKGGGGFDDAGFGGDADDVPFITNDCMLTGERWWACA